MTLYDMDQLDYCKRCTERKFDPQQGTVCGLTMAKPTFEDQCVDFNQDPSVKAYQGAPLKPNKNRAKVAVIFLWIVLVVEILNLVSNAMQYNLLMEANNGVWISDEAAQANDSRVQAVSALYVLALLVSGITFILWFRRAYYNLHQKVKHLSFHDNWAAGSWFVPFINLYRPYQIMKEIYTETLKYLQQSLGLSNLHLNTKLLGVWWFLWISTGILSQISAKLYNKADTITQMMNMTLLDLISGFMGILAAMFAIKIIKDYSRVEEYLHGHTEIIQ